LRKKLQVIKYESIIRKKQYVIVSDTEISLELIWSAPLRLDK